MLLLTERSGLKPDVIIGLIFTSFFGLGLFMVSVSPVPGKASARTGAPAPGGRRASSR